MSLVHELEHRHVFRVAITYVVVAWLILQVADVLLDKIGVPEWTFRVVLVILVIGFPVAIMLGWMRFSGLAIVQYKLGHIDAAEEAMASLIESYRDNGLYQQAQVHAQWGDIKASVDALLKARDIGDPGVCQVTVDPLIDALRDDPRFMSLVADVKHDASRE